jgi:hypothetical protein
MNGSVRRPKCSGGRLSILRDSDLLDEGHRHSMRRLEPERKLDREESPATDFGLQS